MYLTFILVPKRDDTSDNSSLLRIQIKLGSLLERWLSSSSRKQDSRQHPSARYSQLHVLGKDALTGWGDQIWQIADTENRGLLTPAGFSIVLRLIGYAQAGRQVSLDLALTRMLPSAPSGFPLTAAAGGPLPKFDGVPAPAAAPNAPAPGPIQPQSSGGPIRVPPLTPDKVNQYTSLFEDSGSQNGMMSGKSVCDAIARFQSLKYICRGHCKTDF